MNKSINSNSQNIKFPPIDSSISFIKNNNSHRSNVDISDIAMKKMKQLLKESNDQLLAKILNKKPIHSYIDHLVNSTSKLSPSLKSQSSPSICSASARKQKSRNILSLCKNEIKQFQKLRQHYLSRSSFKTQILKTEKNLNKMQCSINTVNQLEQQPKKKKFLPNKNLAKYYRSKKEKNATQNKQVESSNSAILNFLKKKEQTKNGNAIKLKKYADISMEQFLTNTPQQDQETQRQEKGKIRAKVDKQRKSYSQNKSYFINHNNLEGWTNTQVLIYDYDNSQF